MRSHLKTHTQLRVHSPESFSVHVTFIHSTSLNFLSRRVSTHVHSPEIVFPFPTRTRPHIVTPRIHTTHNTFISNTCTPVSGSYECRRPKFTCPRHEVHVARKSRHAYTRYFTLIYLAEALGAVLIARGLYTYLQMVEVTIGSQLLAFSTFQFFFVLLFNVLSYFFF